MPEPSTFQILDIESDFALEFQFFPEEIVRRTRANWEPQNTTFGTKPLFYANSDPQVISISNAYIDYTHENVSAESDVELLQMQMREVEQGGPPPALLAIYGNTRFRCVLTDLTIRETMFTADAGEPTRLCFDIELMELQEDGETTSVQEGYNEDVQPG